MDRIHIKNARIVLPDSVTEPTDIFLQDGKITSIGKNEVLADITINANNGYLLAGFIDLHVHGGGDADFMDGTVEAFEKVVSTHLSHGTTTLVPTAMTATEEDLTVFLNTFKKFKATSKVASVTPGVHLEGPYFSAATKKSSGAQPGNLLRTPNMDEIDRLLSVADGNILRWDAAPELQNIDAFANKLVPLGITCSIAHSAATSEEAQHGFDIGFSHVTHFYNAVTTYHKEGQQVLAGVVEAAYLNDDVTVELICDGKHIPRDILKLALKIKGADKVCAITDAMRLAGTNKEHGKLGSNTCGTDVIVDDGVAKLPDMSSFAGSIATSDHCLRVLCCKYGIDLITASKMLSTTPARILGINNKGSIEIGKDADLVLVDERFIIQKVIKNNRIVKQFQS